MSTTERYSAPQMRTEQNVSGIQDEYATKSPHDLYDTQEIPRIDAPLAQDSAQPNRATTPIEQTQPIPRVPFNTAPAPPPPSPPQHIAPMPKPLNRVERHTGFDGKSYDIEIIDGKPVRFTPVSPSSAFTTTYGRTEDGKPFAYIESGDDISHLSSLAALLQHHAQERTLRKLEEGNGGSHVLALGPVPNQPPAVALDSKAPLSRRMAEQTGRLLSGLQTSEGLRKLLAGCALAIMVPYAAEAVTRDATHALFHGGVNSSYVVSHLDHDPFSGLEDSLHVLDAPLRVAASMVGID